MDNKWSAAWPLRPFAKSLLIPQELSRDMTTIEDLAGLGKATEKLLDVVAKGIGVLYKPRAIRAEAEARAYEIRVLGEANIHIERTKSECQLAAAINSKIQMADAEQQLAERARMRLVQTELQRQRNVEAIVHLALEDPPKIVADDPVNSDWTRTLFRLGQEVSDATMQKLWASVLNAEVAKPGSFSIRSLQTLATLSRDEIEAFQRLCSLSNGSGNVLTPVQTGLADFVERRHQWFLPWGLSDTALELLQETGLLAEGVNIFASAKLSPQASSPTDPLSLRLAFPGCMAVFTCIEKKRRELILCSMKLTSVGRELRRLAPATFDRSYLTTLAAAYDVSLRLE